MIGSYRSKYFKYFNFPISFELAKYYAITIVQENVIGIGIGSPGKKRESGLE